MQIKLVVTNKMLNESSECDLAVEEKIIVGRYLGSPILLNGDRLSRHHFSLRIIDGALTIEDLSSNGTWLNGDLLKAQTSARVKSGDIIEIPGYEMQVKVQSIEIAQKPQANIPTSVQSEKPGSTTGKRVLSLALNVFEPREAALLIAAVATFALISFFLYR